MHDYRLCVREDTDVSYQISNYVNKVHEVLPTKHNKQAEEMGLGVVRPDLVIGLQAAVNTMTFQRIV